MTLTDLKQRLEQRLSVLESDLHERRKTVVLLESDCGKARREADVTDGAVQATKAALAELDAAVQAEELAKKARPPGARPPQPGPTAV